MKSYQNSIVESVINLLSFCMHLVSAAHACCVYLSLECAQIAKSINIRNAAVKGRLMVTVFKWFKVSKLVRVFLLQIITCSICQHRTKFPIPVRERKITKSTPTSPGQRKI